MAVANINLLYQQPSAAQTQPALTLAAQERAQEQEYTWIIIAAEQEPVKAIRQIARQ